MKKLLALFTISVLLFSNCEYLEDNLDGALSDEEIIDGLKTALNVGADSAASGLSIANGYYGNQLVKIPLPEEAEIVRDFVTTSQVASFFNLDQQFENVIESVNRAAEDAAKEAAPIFKDAIVGLSISEGWDILNGTVPDGGTSMKSAGFDSTAATQFLKGQTFTSLTNLYAPKINTALGKDLGLGFSATTAWTTLTNNYNNVINSTAFQAAVTAAAFTGNSIDVPGEMNTDLGVFSTQKALDGLFLKVGDEEKKIRKNPWEWALDILHKVFGSVTGN